MNAILQEKVNHAKELIASAIKQYPKIGVACSFGKDSMATVHIARQVDPQINIFSIMTQFKPKETFEYLRAMDKTMNLRTMVYLVGKEIPDELKDAGVNVRLLSGEDFSKAEKKIKNDTGKEIYEAYPDECCKHLKVEPTKIAVQNLDAWVCGLRNTEGQTRLDYQEVENRGGMMKINPILTFTEKEVLEYLKDNNIPLHPFYEKIFPDGKRYRSLGCAPCTQPIFSNQLERDGRWQQTSKCGGECGIHTQNLK